MESTSQELRVHCSEKAAKLDRMQDPSLVLIRRGTIDVKGKGHMTTYWLKVDVPADSEDGKAVAEELLTEPVADLEVTIDVLPVRMADC
jgi:hypothetical protein